jgi:hypothetical protein
MYEHDLWGIRFWVLKSPTIYNHMPMYQSKQRSVVGRLLLSVPFFMHKRQASNFEHADSASIITRLLASGQVFGRKEEVGLPVAELLRVDKARLKRGEFRNLLLGVSL